MKYKHINAMLHNFGHSFVSSMNYVDDEYIIDVLTELAFQVSGHELEINFSTGHISPFGEYPVRLYKSILPFLIERKLQRKISQSNRLGYEECYRICKDLYSPR